ncbi:helix-turn-helix domain-containing protein [Hymenobacter cavernae]|uniref:AraC family transcriptional regulator n=1 Tax=Hymenobacter cavernae TaxID=2044852 RepID=A0ABQ1UP07_9BACT|nr:helix-turn-helix domain-containing protein [Hymenobacter cavernae]GGF22541.1 AraC family transcriptional regulator [Hymenobacter cavernae]
MATTSFQPYAVIRGYYALRLLQQASTIPMTESRLIAPSTASHLAPVRLDGAIGVVTMEEARRVMGSFSRRDHFKVVLVLEGANELHYATRSYAVDKPALVFTNRLVPYAWEVVEGSGEQQGYICGFTEDFLHSAMRGVGLKDPVLYKVDGNPVYFLSDEQRRYLTEVFVRMRRDLDTDYPHKYDLLRNQLSTIIHEAAQMQPAHAYSGPPTNAAERITNLFLTLLDVQFPITSLLREPILKHAQEFADRLSVHVNHLNRSVKEVTGKPTTTHIAERVIGEAKVLLQHTDWSVADIAYNLGFGYANYFANFFKKHTGISPLAFRKAA